MYIKQLTLQNFKCFEDLTIDFENIQGLYQIKGNIGSGKTTIAEGILFSIYGSINGKKNGDLIRWGEKHGRTSIIFTSYGKTIEINREMNSYGQSPMSVLINGEMMECPNKRDMQSQLEDEYLDVPRQIMEMLCVISFDNFSSLSQMNTKTTRMFLDNVLGLDLVTTYMERAKERASEHKSKANEAQIQIQALQSEKNRNSLGPTLIGGSNIKEIENNIVKINQQIKTAKANAAADEALLEDKKNEYTEELRSIASKVGEITAIGKRLTSEIKFIEQGTCPTCGAPIDQSHLADKIKERDFLRESIVIQNTRKNDVNTKITDIYGGIQEVRNKLQTQLDDLNKKLNNQNSIISSIQTNEKYKKWMDERFEELEKELTTYQQIYEENETTSNKYSELSTVIGTSIRSKIVEGIVPIINKYCSILSDSVGMDFCPCFDSEFNCSIRRNIDEISRASLSTGQGKMVDTIIILAILVSIARHVNCNVLLLDELMSNLDNDSRSQLLFTIKQYMQDKTILIVSHQELDKTILDGMVKVNRNTNNSSTMQIDKYEATPNN